MNAYEVKLKPGQLLDVDGLEPNLNPVMFVSYNVGYDGVHANRIIVRYNRGMGSLDEFYVGPHFTPTTIHEGEGLEQERAQKA